jgi:fatty acid hydroxylase domain-containing protein 2
MDWNSVLFDKLSATESLWMSLVRLGFSLPTTIFLALGIIPMIFFYIYGLLLFIVDFYAPSSFKAQYKIQPSITITANQYLDALKVSVFNWCVLGLPYLAFLAYVVIPHIIGDSLPPIPSAYVFGRDLIVFVLIEEVMFYFSHRALHHGKLYSGIHKFHHTFTAPFGIAAIYAHPIEHMVGNVIPVSLGSLVMKSHPVMACIWGVLALFNTMTVHSGYDFNRLCFIFPSPYFHDWHHEKFNENFGAIQLLDIVFQTNKNYAQKRRDNTKTTKSD